MACWLVTGGCGFIGSHLVEALLARGDCVRVIDDLSTGKRHAVLAGAEIIVGDVADRELLARALEGADGCFHLAAIASVQRCERDWRGGLHSNVAGTVAVLEAAGDAAPDRPRPVVYASSSAVYGDNPAVPLAESAGRSPLSSYGAHKMLGEMYAKAAWSNRRVPSIGLRLFNVYGPRQDPSSPYSGVISIFVDRLGAGGAIEIHGDGGQTRDFVYVVDVVAHLLAAMAGLREGALVLNVCTGRATTVLDLVNTVVRLYGRPPTFCFRPSRDGDIRISIGDPSFAVQRLGLAARISVEDGLRRMLGNDSVGRV
ncbi:MAG TPA: NAD-dependent epimerase/dehydratase family protein [Stellaceae bacterium]|nr:NAD-dependent epimerase/dehydratase family protein [Stellaceae bacterium]